MITARNPSLVTESLLLNFTCKKHFYWKNVQIYLSKELLSQETETELTKIWEPHQRHTDIIFFKFWTEDLYRKRFPSKKYIPIQKYCKSGRLLAKKNCLVRRKCYDDPAWIFLFLLVCVLKLAGRVGPQSQSCP